MKITDDITAIGEVDLVVICVKGYHTQSAVKGALPIIGKETRILSIQNGVGNIETVADIIGGQGKVMGRSMKSNILPISFTHLLYSKGEDLAFGYTVARGDHGLVSIGTADSADFDFHIPNDFSSLVDAAVVLFPDATETIQWDVTTDFGASGEAYNANSDSITNDTLAVTDDQIAEAQKLAKEIDPKINDEPKWPGIVWLVVLLIAAWFVPQDVWWGKILFYILMAGVVICLCGTVPLVKRLILGKSKEV